MSIDAKVKWIMQFWPFRLRVLTKMQDMTSATGFSLFPVAGAEFIRRDIRRHIRPDIRRHIQLALFLTALVSMGWPASLRAATPETPLQQAGLVVVYEDGTVDSRCVAFDDESISGYDLLARGGFVARTEVTSMGASVCSVDGQGCGEGEDCFCQCKSSTCTYWTYWQLLPDGWRYANAGAATLQVHEGDVQGWVWGESKPNSPAENTPPALTFAQICHADAAIYGLEPMPTVSQTGYALTQSGLVALVVAVPLLLGGAWWLLQRRRVVQP
jgi:hypothetical protein